MFRGGGPGRRPQAGNGGRCNESDCEALQRKRNQRGYCRYIKVNEDPGRFAGVFLKNTDNYSEPHSQNRIFDACLLLIMASRHMNL